MTAYYNEFDPKAAAWLRELIRQGHIAPGDVDERDIRDVTPSELVRYTQCHFFAGIGVWSHALRNAGWPDDRPVWTGSCPCQPFSTAGKGDGLADERHLWPFWHYLISECSPAEIYGEQVADGGGEAWLDVVLADLEGSLYAAGALDICAAGVGAPHIRQRIYFKAERLAVADSQRGRGRQSRRKNAADAWKPGETIRMADANGARSPEDARDACEVGSISETQCEPEHRAAVFGGGGGLGRVAHSDSNGRDKASKPGLLNAEHNSEPCSDIGGSGIPGPTNGFWRDADWIICRDPDGPAWRPIEPGTFPLAHGAPARMGLLRGYGNAINAKVAQAVIEVSM